MKHITIISLLLFSCSKEKIEPAPIGCINRTISNNAPKAIILLDFNGQENIEQWPVKNVSGWFEKEKQSIIFDTVLLDFKVFPVTLTTNEDTMLQSSLPIKLRVLITNTDAWATEVSGLAFTGSIKQNIPCFVFPERLSNNPSLIAHTISHEIGHSFGLYHQLKPLSIMSETYSANKTWIDDYNVNGDYQRDEAVIKSVLKQ